MFFKHAIIGMKNETVVLKQDISSRKFENILIKDEAGGIGVGEKK